MGEIKNAYKILVSNPESKETLPKLKRRLEDNIKSILVK
jgi:hypothetical protein